ncbi:methylmalonyl Co-A mutase-associated GTPase MeaB [Adhaeribacter aquaticus]|uniref:methylmalonyl Co-A mutase-associated GTPase MeaB n=1 Tax=Adhaeribacter aquaticus TaxID=299567 RepID=UPI000403A490|nr:methylmalonyl Co-A mutase-associated GTPase MeaB [Adhaeribacter aquaticus]
MVKRFYVDQYADRIIAGDRIVLSRAITLVESTLPSDQELAQQVINRLLPHTGKSIRIGITGAPGVGKSTFIEAFGNYLITRQKKVAVLAVDPSSQRTGGSILGDKTRMETLATNPAAYIRPSPAGKSLGGVAQKTREAILLCEAAGFDTILVETVGVGQSETAVHGMVDFFLLLLLAGAGDELQGIKKGIMELGDALVITKADGANYLQAKKAKSEVEQALQLFSKPESGWFPQVTICSALENKGINVIWNQIDAYFKLTHHSGFFQKKRKDQNLFWLHETIRQALLDNFFAAPAIKSILPELEQQVLDGSISPTLAAQKLLNLT